MIQIIDGIVYVNSKATTDPQLIGLAILDAAEEGNVKITICAPKRNVIMVDDLCAFGGTFIGGARALELAGIKAGSLVVAHCENSIYQLLRRFTSSSFRILPTRL